MRLANLVTDVLDSPPLVRVECYDGSAAGPVDAICTVCVNSPDALRYMVQAPGELGFARAYVSGALTIKGDLLAGLDPSLSLTSLRLRPRHVRAILGLLGRDAVHRLPPPPDEIRLGGRLHGRGRDSAAISSHYDLPNGFYELLLGDSMTYSCAVFTSDDNDLDTAQHNKHELICRKLGLGDGDRLLDIGCGWGEMVIHAARHHGARCVGVTLSREQFDLANKRVSDAGVSDLVELRLQDYRDVDDDPFDAVSSIGMAEHVGWPKLGTYAGQLAQLVRPGGRVLNHQITNWVSKRPRRRDDGFIQRYVFPDGELYSPSVTVAALQAAGLEVRHVESLREHYAMTLRHWVANLETHWDDAVERIGLSRARIWLLYLAAASRNFEAGRTSIHQTLAVRAGPLGESGMALRPQW
ncbi:MAG: cyclopropane-fatty-acyl-phospholipid synthase [Actinomycetota bacterium]|nr:cyclopropane-fatty-acyl-phospholipid synthase [Actinomycetota bacterium]